MARLLDSIDGPAVLHTMSHEQLGTLAREIRQELLDVVSANGGHLAPNLGVVELTLALHATFDSPTDKLVWDVGHQTYVHKLLTGRLGEFHTLRAMGGLSGFPKPCESAHDCFATGHSSTSISAAVGLAAARDLSGQPHHVVAVIGDGSLTGGMAYEALNHAGHLGKRLIVVLNDNEMSIAHNVGAMAQYLNRLRMDPTVKRVKEDIAALIGRIPVIGGRLVAAAQKLKSSVKYLVVPGMLFEELGFTYLGPIDGHNTREIVRALDDAKARTKPVLVHVVTTKGKGYAPAEASPERFHSTGPFNVANGDETAAHSVATYTDVFEQCMVEIGSRHPGLVAITASMKHGTGLERFADAFPSRFFDVGIAEQHAVTMAAGLASQGLRPVVAVYSSFAQRAYDQLLHDVCLQNLPVTLVMDHAGLVGQDGPTHHGVYDIAFLRHMPNMTVMAPKDGAEFALMLRWAVEHSGPVAIRVPRGPAPGPGIGPCVPPMPVTLGAFEVMSSGSDVAVIAFGSMVSETLKACDSLTRQGVAVTVVNARFASPLDGDGLLALARTHGLLVTVEEHVLDGGFGSAVLESLSQGGATVRCLRIGLPATPVEHGPRSILLEKCGLTARGIHGTIWNALREKGLKAGRRPSELQVIVH